MSVIIPATPLNKQPSQRPLTLSSSVALWDGGAIAQPANTVNGVRTLKRVSASTGASTVQSRKHVEREGIERKNDVVGSIIVGVLVGIGITIGMVGGMESSSAVHGSSAVTTEEAEYTTTYTDWNSIR